MQSQTDDGRCGYSNLLILLRFRGCFVTVHNYKTCLVVIDKDLQEQDHLNQRQ